MPQLRWTLLALGVLFVILLAWIERRRQRQRFTDHAPAAEREQALDAGSGPMFREPALTLPEMRAREPSSTQDYLPIVEIEDDSLNARRVETGEPLVDPREEKVQRASGSRETVVQGARVYDETRQASLFPEARNFK